MISTYAVIAAGSPGWSVPMLLSLNHPVYWLCVHRSADLPQQQQRLQRWEAGTALSESLSLTQVCFSLKLA